MTVVVVTSDATRRLHFVAPSFIKPGDIIVRGGRFFHVHRIVLRERPGVFAIEAWRGTTLHTPADQRTTPTTITTKLGDVFSVLARCDGVDSFSVRSESERLRG